MALGLIFNPPQHVEKKVVNREIRTRREESHKIIESLDSSKKDFYKLFLKSYNGLFEFVSKQLDIDNFDIFNTEVCESPSFVELELYDDQTLANYINLHRFNDVRYLNKYILKVHEKLKMGGIFIARAETLDIRKPKLFQQHAKPVAQLLHVFHFLYARVMAKLPLLNKLYYFLSRGKNRALSIAEVMGRLYFCGFKIVDLKKTKDDFFFIAQKVKEPVKNVKPSYGIVIKLKRIGRGGKSVYIRKLRTMHPYSEFLQEY